MRFLLFSLCILPICLFGQKECYGSFEVFGAGGFGNDWGVNLTNEKDVPIFTYRMGFGASFKVSRQTLVRTAMQFNAYGDRLISEDELIWGTQRDGMGGFDPSLPSGEPDLPDVLKFNSRHLFVEFGVSVRHYLQVRSRIRPFGEAGLLIGKYGTTVSSSNINKESSNMIMDTFRSVNPIARLGIGADMPLNEKVALYGMVAGQQHLRSLQEPDLVRVQPWQVDLELGIRVFVDPR